jgi:hypothetical protein
MTVNKLILLPAVCFCLTVNAQTKTVTGTISNEQGQSLPAANIMVMNIADSSLVKYAISNKDGNYEMSFSTGGKDVFIRVSCLGYTTVNKPVDADKTTQRIDFALENSVEILPKAVIRSRMAGAKIKGDTISYNLEKYTDGTEQTLKDILNKLPGIDVDENGEVSAQGKKLDKLLVDGKDFFLNQSQMATRNLPAKMVEGVDLINNYNDISMLGDSKPQGISALNISIKQEHKGRITGTMTGAAGINAKYSGKANMFRFDKNLGIAFIGDAGNTGEMAFTLTDYTKFQSSGISHLSRNSGGNVARLDLSSIPINSFSEEVKKKPSETAALNFSYQPNKKIKINSYFIGNHQTQEGSQTITRKVINGTGNFMDIYNNQLEEKNKFLFTNLYLSGDYRYSDNLFISNRIMVGSQNRNHKSDIATDFINISDSIMSKDILAPFDLKEYFLLMYSTKRGGILSVDAYYRYYQKPSNLELKSDSSFLGLPLRATNHDDTYRAVQDNRQGAREFLLKTEYSGILFNYIAIKPSVGINYSSQNLKSILTQNSDGKNYYFSPENDFTNDIIYNNLNINASLHFQKNLGKLRVRAGLDGHYYATDGNSIQKQYKSQKWSLFPYLQTIVFINTAHYIDLKVFQGQQMRQINDLAENKIATDYRSITQSTITDYLYPTQNAALMYTLANFKKNVNLSAFASYEKRRQSSAPNYVSHVGYSELFIATTDKYELFVSQIRFGKGFANYPVDIKMKLGSQILSNSNFINGEKNDFAVHGINAELSMASFSQSAINGETGCEIIWRKNESKLINRATELTTIAPYGKIRIKFNNEWYAASSLRYLKYDAEDTKRNLTYLDASIHYTPSKSRLEFELSATNILNINKIERIVLLYKENYFEERIYQTLPGYCLLKMIYRI